jgi:hypothetical protein
VWVDWTWTFVVDRRGDATRMLVRARIGCGPWWLRLLCRVGIVPADLVMSASQRRGIRRRAEALSNDAGRRAA